MPNVDTCRLITELGNWGGVALKKLSKIDENISHYTFYQFGRISFTMDRTESMVLFLFLSFEFESLELLRWWMKSS